MSDVDLGAPAPADDVPLDRTISPISGRFGAGRAGKAMVFAGLLAGCAAFAFATWGSRRPQPDKSPEQPARQVVAFEPLKAPTLASPGYSAPALTPGATVPARPAAADGDGTLAGQVGDQARTARASQLQAIRAAPLLAFSQAGAPLDGVRAVPTVGTGAADTSGELDGLRRGSAIGAAKARRLGDRSFLILAGTSIPCILQTAMDTATPGYVSCVIPSDVYSDNGRVVLLEKGAKVLGEYRSSLRQGQNRLFVLWTRAVTPDGVAIDLASPASDGLGRAGFDGDLDRHFWARFGGALLLSIVDDGAYALAGHDNGGQSARLPSDAAGIAVQHSVDIPPTLRQPQGAEVAIFAAQDFDFSAVYALKGR